MTPDLSKSERETLKAIYRHTRPPRADAATGETVRRLRGHRDTVSEVRFSPDGSLVGSAARGALVGVVTDGDLRRHLTKGSSLLDRQARDVMTRTPVTIARSMLAVEALRLMEERKITSLVVTGPKDRAEGVLHLHDLWRTQMI